MEVIILSVTEYKEKDGIADAVSEEGPLSFLVRGVFDPKSKNAALNSPLVIADVDFSEGKFSKYRTVRSSLVTYNPRQYAADYEGLSSILFLSEITKKLLQEEERGAAYGWLKKAILSLKENNDFLSMDMIYLANVMKIAGYEFEVNRCVFCGGTKGIVAFSFRDGGFVCRNCVDPTTEHGLNGEQMLLLRDAFRAEEFLPVSSHYSRENARAVLSRFDLFISDSFGTSLNSIGLLLK